VSTEPGELHGNDARGDGLRAQPTPEPLRLDANVGLVLNAVRRVVFPLRGKGHKRPYGVCQLVEVSRQPPKLLRSFIGRSGSLEHVIRTLDGTGREGIDLTHAEEAIQSPRDRRLGCPSVLSPGTADASRVWRARYLISVSILNIGRYMLMMITPTIRPTPIIISGSMMEVSDWIAASTSSS